MRAPADPIAIEDVIAAWPTLRQSLLSKFDDCPLSAFFEMKYANGWNTHPQARGTLFHRYAAELLRTMKKADHETIPVSEAIEILIEVCYQRNVPVEDIVRVPLREMKDLRMAAIKFARDNTFSTRKIVDIEKRLAAPLAYITDDGQIVERTLTGQIDCLLYEAPNGAVVLDWKDTWGLPPEPDEIPPDERFDDDELKGISYHGYFQQRFYGWLVMKNYSNIDKVTLREFYVRKTKVRKATLHRHQLDDVEEQLRVLVHDFDRAFGSGAPPRPHAAATIGYWKPQPGKHCGFCVGARQCPIPEHVRIETGGAITSREMAKRAAGELNVIERARTLLREALKGWIETSGEEYVEVKASKGRRVIGWRQTKRGRRFDFHVPDDSDRGTHVADARLEEAMKESTAQARKQRLGRRKAGRR